MSIVASALGFGLLSIADVLFGSSTLSQNTSALVPHGSRVDDVLQNSKDFTDKYLSEQVISSDSEQPYISSNELVRPSGTSGRNNNDDEKPAVLPSSGVLGLAGTSAVLGGLGSVAGGSKFWKYLGIVVGCYVVYKVVK